MSQITVENIKRSSETVARSTRGVAAAWVNFNGTGTIAARDSENVSSLTDHGTGQYTVTYTSAMSNGSYAISVAATPNATNSADIYVDRLNTPIGSSHRLNYVLPGTSYYDVSYVYSTVHGDLA